MAGPGILLRYLLGFPPHRTAPSWWHGLGREGGSPAGGSSAPAAAAAGPCCLQRPRPWTPSAWTGSGAGTSLQDRLATIAPIAPS